MTSPFKADPPIAPAQQARELADRMQRRRARWGRGDVPVPPATRSPTPEGPRIAAPDPFPTAFPRSATLRFVAARPGISASVVLPIAALLVLSPGVRRRLPAVARLATHPLGLAVVRALLKR